MHNDTAGPAHYPVITVIKGISTFQAGATRARVIGPDSLQGCSAIKKLHALLLARLVGSLDGYVTAALTDLPEPHENNDYQ